MKNKDIFEENCKLYVDHINKDKKFIILKAFFKLNDSDANIYATNISGKYSYFVKLRQDQIVSIKTKDFLLFENGLEIEYSVTKYNNVKGEEIISKWADASQFNFLDLKTDLIFL